MKKLLIIMVGMLIPIGSISAKEFYVGAKTGIECSDPFPNSRLSCHCRTWYDVFENKGYCDIGFRIYL